MAVVIDISTSADGFVARPDGTAGPVHDWFFTGDEPTGEAFRTSGADTDILRENLARTGALVAGRRTYDLVGGWGGNHPAGAPVVVVTHHPPESTPAGRTPITFAASVREAVAAAQEIAADRDVFVMGGASVIAQTLTEGLAGLVQLHIAPVFLGRGVRLVEALPREIPMTIDRVVHGPGATHLRYRIA